MAEFLLVESEDSAESAGPARFLADAAGLVQAGHRVTLFLVQDGVRAAAREGPALAEALAGGAVVLADDHSLHRRALPAERLHPEVTVTGIDALADRLLAPGVRVVWH